MELKYKNITKYSKKVYDEFLKFHTKKYFGKYIICTGIVVAALIYMAIFNAINKKWTTMYVMIIIGIVFIIYRIYSQKMIVKNENKSNKIKNEEVFEFNFYNDYIIIKKEEEQEKITYKGLYKLFETDDYFYLYINRDNAFLLNKKGFEIGEVNKFKEFILKRI